MTEIEGVVRSAREADVESVVELSETWAAEDSTCGIVPTPASTLSDHLGPYFWVAERGTAVVGYAYGRVEVSQGLAVIPAGERYLEIEELYVLSEYRNEGLGSDLVRALLRVAAENRVTRGLVHPATKDWPRIVRFYEQFDFKMWYVQMYR